LLILWTGVDVFEWSYVFSAALSFLGACVTGYTLNHSFTFGITEQTSGAGLLRYLGTASGSLVCSLVLMYILVDLVAVHYLLANILAAVILLGGNYLAHKFWTFRQISD
jgi:putative flippase GtrA